MCVAITILPQAVVDVLKFYTATTAGESSSETKFMTVSKKIGKIYQKEKLDTLNSTSF